MVALVLRPYAHFQNKQATTVAGGGVSAAITTCPLNTTVFNNIDGLSRSGNDITIPAGDYWMEASLACFSVYRAEALWYNVTDDITQRGNANYFNQARDTQWGMPIRFRFTAPAGPDTVYRLQYYSSHSKATDGGGIPVSDGEDEIHVELWIYEIA